MRIVVSLFTTLCLVYSLRAAEVRLLDLEPTDAQQIIEKQDQSLNYAPKVDSNVPAVRYLGNEPHHVLEDIYLARQYHGQDGIGGYLYGYNVPDIAKTEKKKAGGDLRGAYNYIAGNGQEIKVQYWDDGTGFHQIDNVPKILPKQVDDSPEVKAAKEKFLARWHEEAERNTHPVAYPYNTEGQYPSGPLPPQVQLQLQQHQQQIPQGQYQPGQAQYQHGQSQYQSGQAQYQPGQAQFQAGPSDYRGEYSEQQNAYSQYPQAQRPNQFDKSSGQYRPEEEETTGPPKGFFYKFDYPVGIIVNKGEALRSDELKQVYEKNKSKYEGQLHAGGADAGSQSGYYAS